MRSKMKLTTDKPCDLFNLGTDSITKVTTIAKLYQEEMGLLDVKIRFTGRNEAGLAIGSGSFSRIECMRWDGIPSILLMKS